MHPNQPSDVLQALEASCVGSEPETHSGGRHSAGRVAAAFEACEPDHLQAHGALPVEEGVGRSPDTLGFAPSATQSFRLTHVKSFWLFSFLLLFLAAGSALIWYDVGDWGYETTERGPVSGDFTWHAQFMIQSVRRPMIAAEIIVAAFAVIYAVKRVRPVALWVIVAIGILVQLSFYYYWCHAIDSVILSWNPNVPPYESGIAGEHLARRSLDLKILLAGVPLAALTVAISIILRRREQGRA